MRVVNSTENSGTGVTDGNTVTATLEVPQEATKVVFSVDDNADGAPSNHALKATTDGGGELSNALFLERRTGNTTVQTVDIDAIEGTLTITVTNQSGGSADFRIQALAAADVN